MIPLLDRTQSHNLSVTSSLLLIFGVRFLTEPVEENLAIVPPTCKSIIYYHLIFYIIKDLLFAIAY